MRAQATRAASAARVADPAACQGIAAGHTPDVAWGDNVAGPIRPLNPDVDSYVGGASQAVAPGTSYNRVVLHQLGNAMIADLIKRAVVAVQELYGTPAIKGDPEKDTSRIPTLRENVYRDCSPMLAERFSMFARWETATHGHWLSVQDMAGLWGATADEFLSQIKKLQESGSRSWPDEAGGLFRPERLSLFAGSDLNYEKVYLLWLDSEDEPEIWVYDQNGESRYNNLKSYLIAYLDDDVSASQKTWRA